MLNLQYVQDLNMTYYAHSSVELPHAKKKERKKSMH